MYSPSSPPPSSSDNSRINPFGNSVYSMLTTPPPTSSASLNSYDFSPIKSSSFQPIKSSSSFSSSTTSYTSSSTSSSSSSFNQLKNDIMESLEIPPNIYDILNSRKISSLKHHNEIENLLEDSFVIGNEYSKSEIEDENTEKTFSNNFPNSFLSPINKDDVKINENFMPQSEVNPSFFNGSDIHLEDSELFLSTISMSISHDGTLLASSHGDHSVKVFIFPVSSYDPKVNHSNSNPSSPTSPSTTTSESKTKLIQIRNFKGHPRTPWTVKFHPKSANIIASGCLGGYVFLWHVTSYQCLAKLSLTASIVPSLSFSPGGEYLAIANGSNVYLWSWKDKIEYDEPENHDNYNEMFENKKKRFKIDENYTDDIMNFSNSNTNNNNNNNSNNVNNDNNNNRNRNNNIASNPSGINSTSSDANNTNGSNSYYYTAQSESEDEEGIFLLRTFSFKGKPSQLEAPKIYCTNSPSSVSFASTLNNNQTDYDSFSSKSSKFYNINLWFIENTKSMRAIVFHPNGKYFFVVSYTSSTIKLSKNFRTFSLYIVPLKVLLNEKKGKRISLSQFPILLPSLHLYTDYGIDISKCGRYLVTCSFLYKSLLTNLPNFSSNSAISTTSRTTKRYFPAISLYNSTPTLSLNENSNIEYPPITNPSTFFNPDIYNFMGSNLPNFDHLNIISSHPFNTSNSSSNSFSTSLSSSLNSNTNVEENSSENRKRIISKSQPNDILPGILSFRNNSEFKEKSLEELSNSLFSSNNSQLNTTLSSEVTENSSFSPIKNNVSCSSYISSIDEIDVVCDNIANLLETNSKSSNCDNNPLHDNSSPVFSLNSNDDSSIFNENYFKFYQKLSKIPFQKESSYYQKFYNREPKYSNQSEYLSINGEAANFNFPEPYLAILELSFDEKVEKLIEEKLEICNNEMLTDYSEENYLDYTNNKKLKIDLLEMEPIINVKIINSKHIPGN